MQNGLLILILAIFSLAAALAIYVLSGAPNLDVLVTYDKLSNSPWETISWLYLGSLAVALFSTTLAIYLLVKHSI